MKTIFSTQGTSRYRHIKCTGWLLTCQTGIKRGYNLAAVSFDGDGETDNAMGFHRFMESPYQRKLSSTRNYILNKGMKLKMRMERLLKTELYQFTDNAKSLSV
jgi:hypothetical protein